MNKIIFILFTAFILQNQARAAATCGVSNATLSSIESVYQSGKFRIYYSNNPTSGDYLPDRTDNNMNGVPDFIENIAIQANATTDALTYLGFTHPLESDRYKNVAEFIDIHVNLSSGNGLAYEGVTNYKNKLNKENKCTLILQLRKDVQNLTTTWTAVTHEVFHLYQYGSNQFKDAWYLEGLASWSENLFKAEAGNYGAALLPVNQTELLSNYSITYNNKIWSRLAYLSDSTTGQLNLPSELLNRKYIDGVKVFKNENLKGHAFIKSFLINLKNKSDAISIQKNWHPHQWLEADQVSPSFRPDILKVIQDTMLQYGINDTTEEQSFLGL